MRKLALLVVAMLLALPLHPISPVQAQEIDLQELRPLLEPLLGLLQGTRCVPIALVAGVMSGVVGGLIVAVIAWIIGWIPRLYCCALDQLGGSVLLAILGMVTGPVVLDFTINSVPGIGAINEIMTKMGLPNPLTEIIIGGLIGAFVGAMLGLLVCH
jgi:hypothetical protein